jgi:hypothetical protein
MSIYCRGRLLFILHTSLLIRAHVVFVHQMEELEPVMASTKSKTVPSFNAYDRLEVTASRLLGQSSIANQ